MGYMFPVCEIPRELISLWWIPVQQSGAAVRDLNFSQNVIEFQQSSKSDPIVYLDISSRAIVENKDAAIIVSAFSDAMHWYNLRGGILMPGGINGIEYNISCEEAQEFKRIEYDDADVIFLAESLVRIFVASGGQHLGGWKGFQKMYHCPYDLILEVWQCLEDAGFRCVPDLPSDLKIGQPSKPNLFFPCGTVVDGCSSIRLTTGPAINPLTGEDRFYISIDFRDSLVSKIINHSLARRIERLIFTIGDVIPLKKKMMRT